MRFLTLWAARLLLNNNFKELFELSRQVVSGWDSLEVCYDRREQL